MPPCYNFAWLFRDEGELLAILGGKSGSDRLVKYLDGKIKLLGGTPDDRTAAKQWCSLFLHEAALRPPPTAL